MSVYDCPLSCSTRPSDSGGGRPESAASQSDRATAHQQEVGGVTRTPPLHCRLYSTTTSLRAVLHHHLTAGCTPPPPHCRLYSTTTSLWAVLHHHLTAGCTPPPPHCGLYSTTTSLQAVLHHHLTVGCPPPPHCRLYSTTTSLWAVLHHHLTAGCTPPPPHCRLYSRYKKKMDDYECRFVSLQRHSPATAEVTQLRDTLTGLAERSESM